MIEIADCGVASGLGVIIGFLISFLSEHALRKYSPTKKGEEMNDAKV